MKSHDALLFFKWTFEVPAGRSGPPKRRASHPPRKRSRKLPNLSPIPPEPAECGGLLHGRYTTALAAAQVDPLPAEGKRPRAARRRPLLPSPAVAPSTFTSTVAVSRAAAMAKTTQTQSQSKMANQLDPLRHPRPPRERNVAAPAGSWFDWPHANARSATCPPRPISRSEDVVYSVKIKVARRVC